MIIIRRDGIRLAAALEEEREIIERKPLHGVGLYSDYILKPVQPLKADIIGRGLRRDQAG